MAMRAVLRIRRSCFLPCSSSPTTPLSFTSRRSFAVVKLHSSESDEKKRKRIADSAPKLGQSMRGQFPTFVPMMTVKSTDDDPDDIFEKFRANTLRRMRIKFGLKKETEVADDERGFCIADWPLLTSYVPPGMSLWKMFINSFKRRQRLQAVQLRDPNFTQRALLHDAAKLVQMVSGKLAERDYDTLTEVVHESLLAELKPRVDALTKKQRRLLAFGEGDYVLATPLLISIDLREEENRQFADFFILDAAMFEVHKMKFEPIPDSHLGTMKMTPTDLRNDLKENIVGDDKKVYKLDLSAYRFAVPRQIVTNVVLTRQLKPTVSDEYVISHLNIIVTP